MNSLFSLSLLPLASTYPPKLLSLPFRKLAFNRICHSFPPIALSFSAKSGVSFCHRPSCVSATIPEGTVPVINLEDFNEKDWSFLESMETDCSDHDQKLERIIKAGEISDSSRVLVSVASEAFVDRLMESWPSQLMLIVHDSLFVLACVKEKYDKVKCWQGELIYVPEKWSPLDTVFLYYLPALPFSLDEIFQTLSKRCSPGARVVISHPQGREGLEQQRKENPDVVISELPDHSSLQSIAKKHSLHITDFTDEPGIYLAVLKYSVSLRSSDKST